jgi:hypothetical protein
MLSGRTITTGQSGDGVKGAMRKPLRSQRSSGEESTSGAEEEERKQ